MKRPNLQPSTRPRAIIILAVASASLAACQTLVTTVPLAELLSPLDMAMSEAPDAVESRARAGDGQAQLAMAIVYDEGLQGRPHDGGLAVEWRQRAQANRRFTPITQYTAAFNGQPSRVNIINVPVQTVPAAQWQAINKCLVLLTGAADGGSDACGSVEETSQRRSAWRQAMQR